MSEDLLSSCPSLIQILSYIDHNYTVNCNLVSRRFNHFIKTYCCAYILQLSLSRVESVDEDPYIVLKVRDNRSANKMTVSIREREVRMESCKVQTLLDCYNEPIYEREVDSLEEGLRMVLLPLSRRFSYKQVSLFCQRGIDGREEEDVTIENQLRVPLEWYLMVARTLRTAIITRLLMPASPILMDFLPEYKYRNMTLEWSSSIPEYLYALDLPLHRVTIDYEYAEESDDMMIVDLIVDVIKKWHARKLRFHNINFINVENDFGILREVVNMLDASIAIEEYENIRTETYRSAVNQELEDHIICEYHTFIKRPQDDRVLGLISFEDLSDICMYEEKQTGPLSADYYDCRFLPQEDHDDPVYV